MHSNRVKQPSTIWVFIVYFYCRGYKTYEDSTKTEVSTRGRNGITENKCVIPDAGWVLLASVPIYAYAKEKSFLTWIEKMLILLIQCRPIFLDNPPSHSILFLPQTFAHSHMIKDRAITWPVLGTAGTRVTVSRDMQIPIYGHMSHALTHRLPHLITRANFPYTFRAIKAVAAFKTWKILMVLKPCAASTNCKIFWIVCSSHNIDQEKN